MKLCPKCNYSNQDFDTVCNNCGTALDIAKEPGTVAGNNNMSSFDPGPYGVDNPPMPVKTNGMAIASMVLGIVSVLMTCCYGIGLIPGVLSVIFGFVSRKRIKASAGTETGGGMALAGIILGFVGILGSLVMIICIVAVFKNGDFLEQVRQQMNNIENNRTY